MWCKIMLAEGNNCYYCRIKNVEKVGFMKEKFSRIAMGDISEVSDPSSVKDLYISSTGRIWDFYESEPFFIFDGIVIGLYLKGVASVKINGRRYEIKPYSVLLLPPNELLEVESGSSDADRKSLIASTDVIFEYPTPIDTGILSLARRMPVARVSEKQMSRLMDTFDLLEKKYSVIDNSYRDEVCKALFYALLLEIIDLLKKEVSRFTGPSLRQEKLVDDFFVLLSKWYKKERTVTFYAGKMNRTPKYLSTAIKKMTGRSILEWINETVIIEIKMQLKTTDQTVAEISESLNFPDPSTFVQFFKHHTGLTPLQYRKQQ